MAINGQLTNIIYAISSLIDVELNGRIAFETELISLTQKFMSLLFPNLSPEDKKIIGKTILENHQFALDPIEGICEDDSITLFSDWKKTHESPFFERYGRYLLKERHFNAMALKTLDEKVLDPIMNQLGNPHSSVSFEKKGIVMGDVQSGKTLSYIGLINKAADAGYKMIIVFTGTIESLRKQTQERIDEGFTGFDSNFLGTPANKNLIGVGLCSKGRNSRKGISLTSKNTDFVSLTAAGLGFSMEAIKEPAILVIKKNISVLSKLTDWIMGNNSKSVFGKIGSPLLIIDDEADSASINTNTDNEDTDPTRTNYHIRVLINMFSKCTYVGFTATPFANIFINPESFFDKEIGEDLFPKDFIFSLSAPKDYIGANKIFGVNSIYKKAIVKNDDCEKALPSNHTKDFEMKNLPASLEEAIIAFTISNSIRDLRGDNLAHRSMLINISRFVQTHNTILNSVCHYFNEILLVKYSTYSKMEGQLSDPEMKRVQKVFENQFSGIKESWSDVKELLYLSNKTVQIMIVNSGAKMINYDEYKNTSARVIFIGGLAISRGLTLEGLCVSYFYRNSKTYDVLFQMGRWFGYRKNYEDLFRIWMPDELVGWYSIITDAVEELKMEITRMRKTNKKPIEFGLRVKNDTAILKITNPNKMRSATNDFFIKVLGFGEIITTPNILNDEVVNKDNFCLICNVLGLIEQSGIRPIRDLRSNNLMWQDVPYSRIIDIIDSFQSSSRNDMYDKDSLLSFIDLYKDRYLSKWDIVIVEGAKNTDSNIKKVLSHEVHKPGKSFDIKDRCIRIQKAREELNNPPDTISGIRSQNDLDSVLHEYKEKWIKKSHEKDWQQSTVPSKAYLLIKDRNPLLLLYFIDLIVPNNDDNPTNNQELKTKKQFEKNQICPVGIAIAIPKYEDNITEKNTYKINVVAQKNKRTKEYGFIEPTERGSEEI